MSTPKRLRTIVELAEAQGWTYSETADGHPQLVPPAGMINPATGRLAPPVSFAKTPSDVRGDRNSIAQLRRLGLQVPHKGHTKKKGAR